MDQLINCIVLEWTCHSLLRHGLIHFTWDEIVGQVETLRDYQSILDIVENTDWARRMVIAEFTRDVCDRKPAMKEDIAMAYNHWRQNGSNN
jgi:hypothetical protein